MECIFINDSMATYNVANTSTKVIVHVTTDMHISIVQAPTPLLMVTKCL